MDRGLSLPAPYAYGTLGVTATLRAGAPAALEGSLGGGIGLTSHLWLDGSSGALESAPGLRYHSPQIGLNALLVDAPAFELDAMVHVTFVAEDGRPVEQIEPGLSSVLHVAHRLRIDTGLYVDANPGPTTTFGLRVPMNAAFQITEHVHAVVNTGVTVGSFADTRGTTAIPVGVTLGWSDTLGRGPHPPSAGVLPSISFPELIKPGAAETLRLGYATVGITFVYVSRLW